MTKADKHNISNRVRKRNHVWPKVVTYVRSCQGNKIRMNNIAVGGVEGSINSAAEPKVCWN